MIVSLKELFHRAVSGAYKTASMDFIYASIAIFGITAIIGLYLLSFVLRKQETPKTIAVIHGFFAFTGFVILILYCYLYQPGPIEGLIVFIVAALGGGFLLYKDMHGLLPKPLAIIHGILAVIGLILLIVFAWL